MGVITTCKGAGGSPRAPGLGLRPAGGAVYKALKDLLVSTAIGLRKYRIPSDLRSQAGYRLVSTMVGDHMGILGVVVFPLL